MNGRTFVGIILIFLGVLFLLESAGVWDSREVFHDYWPALLVLGGIWLLIRHGSERRERPVAGPQPVTDAPDQLKESNVFGDISLHTVSKKFGGGSVNGVFGEIRLDLSDAAVAEGEQALTVNGVFGDVQITLPKGIPASVNASTVFGHVVVNGTRQEGFSPSVAQESPGYATAPRRMRVHVSLVFGDVEVRE
jgi:lia operon protein LiaF